METKRKIILLSLTAACGFSALPASAQQAPEAEAVAAPAPVAAPAADGVQVTAGDDRSGTFKTVRGQVTIVGAGDARRAAVVGGPLFPGERLLTGPDSVVALTLRDGTILTMDKESSLDLAAFDFNSTTHEGNLWVRVMRGTLRVVSGLIAKVQPENVRVTTPTAVIGVRGTDFIVEAN